MSDKFALLINPWIYDFKAYDQWLRPLGLLRAGAVLRAAGFEAALVDCLDRSHPSQADMLLKSKPDGTGKFLKQEVPKPEAIAHVPRRFGRYGIPLEAFDALLAQHPRPDIVLVSGGLSYWYPGVFEAVRRVKRRWPGAPVVLGGVYATLCAEHAREHSGADAVHCGALTPEFGALVSWLTGGRVFVPAHFADLPAPAHELAAVFPAAAVSLSLGCPMRCTYCASHKVAPRFQQRRPRDAIREILFLVKERGARHIAFYDDALLVNTERVLAPVLEGVAGCGARFYTPNAVHAALVTPAVARLLHGAGFERVMLGFESGDPAFQSRTGGKVSAAQFAAAASALHGAGFNREQTGAYVLCGHPEQDADQIRTDLHACAEHGVAPYLTWYSPAPGSADFEHACVAMGLRPEGDPLLHNSTLCSLRHPRITPDAFQQLNLEAKRVRRDMMPA